MERFERVLLWMDSDTPGVEGAEKFAHKLGGWVGGWVVEKREENAAVLWVK